MAVRVSGTEGYTEEAESLVESYERIPFAELHSEILHLIPSAPCRALDIGSGTGRDAAALAELGHDIVAVEPTEEFRVRAAALQSSPRIEWLDETDTWTSVVGLDHRAGTGLHRNSRLERRRRDTDLFA